MRRDAASRACSTRRSSELTLPLRHEDIIRQQAADKNLDPALIAAVIYQESQVPRPDLDAPAREGLMQILPETADFIAHKSGGIRFKRADLATPQINIAYGAWYLRYLLDHYGGNEMLAVAAYNAGAGQRGPLGRARRRPEQVRQRRRDIPFPETRAYVQNVLERRQQYRDHYADELGLVAKRKLRL